VPCTTSSHTTAAASGTETYLGTWNSCRLLATPANSAMTLPKFVTTSASIRKNVTRKPNSSRMRSLSPLPVAAPMREAISWTTTRAMVVGIITHRRE
jgi:hypothetical protein